MLTRRWLRVRERCGTCDFPIERKEGHFIGAVGMNTIVTFGAVLVALVLTAMFGGRQPPMSLVLGLAALIIGLGVGFFPISKTLWSAIDLIMIPLEPGEADPRFDYTDYVEGS